jgi:alkylation response protein AidB-like acyl-CoA dehydrogenase
LDFSWSEEQEALRRSITQFAQRELAADVVAEDQAQEFSWDGWRKCARFGLQGMPVAEEFGGGGADILTMVGALDALGYGCRNAGLIYSLNAHLWGAVMPIAMFGNGEQKRGYLPQLIGGQSVGAQAASGEADRPGSTSQGTRQGIQAKRSDAGWILNGDKAFVANSGLASLVVVYAAAEGGPTAFIIEKGSPGLTFGPSVERMGLRTSPAGPLRLENCLIPDANRLGEIGSGPALLSAIGEWEPICMLAGELGMMKRQIEASARYAAERRQFGQPISKFPAIAEKLDRMETRLEAARLVLYKAAWLKKQGKHAQRETAIAQGYVADAAIQTCRDALQIHGGYGYMTEYQIERDLRDAITLKVLSGALN